MDAGFRTPLLDMFRRGEVSRDIKMLAARGALAPRPHEQLTLLADLVDDADLEIRLAATETIDAIPRQALEGFLARSDTSPSLREFFAARGIQAAETPAAEADTPLIEKDEPPAVAAPPETQGGDPAEPADPADPAAPADPAEPQSPEKEEKIGAVQRLGALSIAERMKVGMKGTREERAILIHDPNKLVSVAVLSSPKVNESEVESFAKMANVSEEVLRIIGQTRAWMKNYGVVSALAKNPKTPLGVALHLVQRLSERDLKMISLDRNAQEPLRTAVRKRLRSGKDE
jgi:hypothetical protein